MSSTLDMVAMQAGASEQSSRDLQNQLGNVGNLRGRNISPEARAKKLREACEGFESIFIQKMWQEMRNAVPRGGLLQGREEKFWQDMYDQELSKSMTKAGGIGLADMMYAQLSRNLGDASRSTAGMTAGAAFTPSAAPLLPRQNQESPLPDSHAAAASPQNSPASAPKAMPNIYDGEAPAMAEPADNAQQPVQPAVAQPAHAQPTAVAQAAAAQPAAAVQPVAQPVHETRKMEKKHNARKAQTGHNGDSPLDLVAIARREAGDKLGSRAIRPPLKPHRSAKRQAEAEARQQLLAQQQQQPVMTDNRPGTANDLQRAMAAARGEQAANPASATPLADIVARVKASQQNALAAASPVVQPAANPQAGLQPVPNPLGQPAPLNPAGSPANTAALSAQEEAPAVRKVTYTTNIPKNSRPARKGQKDAIRMLNVENTSHNSKAGKGLAAYHVQQQAVGQPQPAAAPQAPVPPASPAPLTAKDVAPAADSGSGFAIPPLTSGDLNV